MFDQLTWWLFFGTWTGVMCLVHAGQLLFTIHHVLRRLKSEDMVPANGNSFIERRQMWAMFFGFAGLAYVYDAVMHGHDHFPLHHCALFIVSTMLVVKTHFSKSAILHDLYTILTDDHFVRVPRSTVQRVRDKLDA